MRVTSLVYQRKEFTAGLVFSIDPTLWIPEENLYVRKEDVVAEAARAAG